MLLFCLFFLSLFSCSVCILLSVSKKNFRDLWLGILGNFPKIEKLVPACDNSPFSHDVTKIQTKKLSLLLSFYFHVILEHLTTFIETNFRFKRVLCFATQDAWISTLLRDAAFSWRPGKLLCGLKTLRTFGDFAI